MCIFTTVSFSELQWNNNFDLETGWYISGGVCLKDEISFDIVAETGHIVAKSGNNVSKQHSTLSKGRNFTINSFDIVAVCSNKVEWCFDKVERCFDIVAGVDQVVLYNSII